MSFYIVPSQCQQQSFDKPYDNHEKRLHSLACFFLINSFSSRVCVCVHIYNIYIYMCIYVCVLVCVQVHVFMYAYGDMNACMGMFTHVCACTLMFTSVRKTVVDAE